MNNKKAFHILSRIALLLVLVVIFYILTSIQPKMIITADITTVNNEDYKRILNNNQVMYPNKNIEKFKHINIKTKMIEPIGVNIHVKIKRNTLLQYLENNNKIQILSGGSFGDNNGKEYNEFIELYLIDLSEDELRNTLQNFKYTITWSNIWHDNNVKIFYLKDYLK